MPDIPFSFTTGDETISGILTVSNPTMRILVNGTIYRFERDYSGCPWLLDRRGNPKDIPERHPFWQGFNRWFAQGEKMDGDLCIYEIRPRQQLRRINRRNAIVVFTPPGWHESDGVEYVTQDPETKP